MGKEEERVVQTQYHCCFSPLFCIERSISCLIHLKIPHFSVCVFLVKIEASEDYRLLLNFMSNFSKLGNQVLLIFP